MMRASNYPFVVAFLAASTLTACFGGPALERTYYTVQYPIEHTWAYDTARYPMMVRVKRLETAMAYDRQEMVYRSNPHEFQYYWYKLWATKPRKMLRETVVSHLRHSNVFQEVVLDITDRLPDYDLVCEILAIEELNASDQQWYAHLSMRLTLTRFEDGSRVWEHAFDERKQVYNRQPVFVVRALSEIAEEQLGHAFGLLDEYLAAETGLEAPPGGPYVVVKDNDPQGEEGAEEPDSNEPRATLKKKRK